MLVHISLQAKLLTQPAACSQPKAITSHHQHTGDSKHQFAYQCSLAVKVT
jgi:hypothetical protein